MFPNYIWIAFFRSCHWSVREMRHLTIFVDNNFKKKLKKFWLQIKKIISIIFQSWRDVLSKRPPTMPVKFYSRIMWRYEREVSTEMNREIAISSRGSFTRGFSAEMCKFDHNNDDGSIRMRKSSLHIFETQTCFSSLIAKFPELCPVSFRWPSPK